MRFPILLAIVLLPLPLGASPGVHVVQGGGAALQTAIDTATDGDVLLIGPGTYSACVVTDKALTLQADPVGAASLEGLQVRDLAAGKTAFVKGVNVRRTPTTSNLPQDVFLLQDCAGSVRLQAVQAVMGHRNWSPGLRVVACADVALEHCILAGSSILPSDPSSFSSGHSMPGLMCEQSVVAVQHGSVDGGQGRDAFLQFWWPNHILHYARAGADACTVGSGSFVFAHGCQFRGGDGGDGQDGGCDVSSGLPSHGTDGGAAGSGLVVDAGSSVTELACELVPGMRGLGGTGMSSCGAQPGAPGAAGAPTSGAVASIADDDLDLVAPTHVRAGQPIGLTVYGTPGDLVLLASSLQTRWVFDPLYEGVFLFGTSARRTVLGTMPASGVLTFTLPTSALPPGTLAVNRCFQLVARHPSGQVQLGGAAFVTLLDPSF